MDRKDFLRITALLPLTGAAMKLNGLNKITEAFDKTERMPVFFLGHGNPMNAITENEYTRAWQQAASTIPHPAAILCISAHWETNGTFVTAMEKPPTIHDFGGFPKALSDFQYPAPGSPAIARQAAEAITKTKVGLDYNRGLDHGCWSVVKHLFPGADVPVIQMSLDYNKPPAWHFELAKELSSLRDKGVLIIGSGNIVHNLGLVRFNDETGYDWAIEANEKTKKLILGNEPEKLLDYQALGREMKLAVPTPEHYLPLLYTLGLRNSDEHVSVFNDKTLYGSLSMTSIKIGT